MGAEASRCPVCDRPACEGDLGCALDPALCHYGVVGRWDDFTCAEGERRLLEDEEAGDCEARRVNWRARALAAEQISPGDARALAVVAEAAVAVLALYQEHGRLESPRPGSPMDRLLKGAAALPPGVGTRLRGPA